jgi:hypothetical protein
MRATHGIWLLCLAACSGDDTGGGGGGGSETQPPEDTLAECTDGVDNADDGIQSYVDCRDADCRPFARDCAPPIWDDTEAPSEMDCLGEPDDFTPGEGMVNVTFGALDYEDDIPIDLPHTLDVYFNNDCGVGDPDLTVDVGAGEQVSAQVAVPNHRYICVLFHAIEGQFRQTVEYDKLTPEDDPGSELDGAMDAITVKESTYAVIPATLGISIESGKGIIAGGFDDCEGNPVANVVVSVDSDDPNIAIRYFVDEFPNREPVTTTEDGLWGIINVPPGEVTVTLEGRLEEGGDLEVLGERVVSVQADTINIADIGVLRK